MLLLPALLFLGHVALPGVGVPVWYTRPASDCSEALSVGNGQLGATLFGGTQEDCIQINDEGSGQPLADLLLTVGHGGEISAYWRTLDPRRGVAEMAYKCGNITYRREVFAAEGVVVVRLETDSDGGLSFEAGLTSPHIHSVKCPRSNHVILEGEMEETGTVFETWLVVQTEGGSARSCGGKLAVDGADAATLVIAAGTGQNPAAMCRKTAGPAVRKTYRQLVDEHQERQTASVEAD